MILWGCYDNLWGVNTGLNILNTRLSCGVDRWEPNGINCHQGTKLARCCFARTKHIQKLLKQIIKTAHFCHCTCSMKVFCQDTKPYRQAWQPCTHMELSIATVASIHSRGRQQDNDSIDSKKKEKNTFLPDIVYSEWSCITTVKLSTCQDDRERGPGLHRVKH